MLGINYASSDDEEITPVVKPQEPIAKEATATITTSVKEPILLDQPQVPSGPVNGPAQGPTVSPPAAEGPQEDGAPGSPYALARTMIQNLTLPTVPNFNIPPSPPGSPPLRPTKKFTQFLELKKKGQHFNQRLEGSTVLRDPGHLQRLMDFAKITEEDQYASTLPEGVAVPATFPTWAYVEELTASQKKITKAKEEANSRNPREAIEFVSATASGTSSGTGTPSAKGGRQSAAERIMAGLDKQQPGKRKELEQRGGRNEASKRWRSRSRSRSPKRRRSRSRERR